MKKLLISLSIVTAGCLPIVFAEAPDGFVEVLTYLEPYQKPGMNFVETGVISSIPVKEGQVVKAGETIITLDTEIAEARLAVAKTQAASTGKVDAMRAEYEVQLDRMQGLVALAQKGTPASQAELKRQEASLAIAKGNLTIALEEQKNYQMQVAQFQAELNRRMIKSPIDGVVVEINKEIGEPVSTSSLQQDEALVRVVQLDKLKCNGHVPSTTTRQMKAGDRLAIRVNDVEVLQAEGVIEYVKPTVDPATSTVLIRLAIDNTDGRIRAGASAMILVPAK